MDFETKTGLKVSRPRQSLPIKYTIYSGIRLVVPCCREDIVGDTKQKFNSEHISCLVLSLWIFRYKKIFSSLLIWVTRWKFGNYLASRQIKYLICLAEFNLPGSRVIVNCFSHPTRKTWENIFILTTVFFCFIKGDRWFTINSYSSRSKINGSLVQNILLWHPLKVVNTAYVHILTTHFSVCVGWGKSPYFLTFY